MFTFLSIQLDQNLIRSDCLVQYTMTLWYLQRYGVLHKNMTPYQILIQPDARVGDRDFFLNYTSALMDSLSLRTGAAVSPRLCHPVLILERYGSWVFCSHAVARALAKENPFIPSFFNDLESFCFLRYLVVCYPATGSLKSMSIPRSASAWFRSPRRMDCEGHYDVGDTSPLLIDDSFQAQVSELLIYLHHFFFATVLEEL